jgi:hypothetical protein
MRATRHASPDTRLTACSAARRCLCKPALWPPRPQSPHSQARNYHIPCPCTRIVTSHPSLHRAIAAQPTGLPAKGRLQHPRRRHCSCCFLHAPHSSCYLINRPTSTIGPAIPNASAHSVPSPAPINKHPRLPSLSLLQRSTARPFACALARRQDNVTVPDQGSAASQGTTYLPQPNPTAPQLETIFSPLPPYIPLVTSAAHCCATSRGLCTFLSGSTWIAW